MDLELWAVLSGISIGIIVGIVIFVLYIRWRVIQFSGNLDNLIREAIKEVEKEMIGINVEKHNGVFYCYRENDNQFVCQANTVDELRAAFKAKFPDKITYLAGGDEAAVNEVKEALEAAVK